MPKYLRRVLSISAADSPNVALGLMQQAQGLEPTGEVVLEGPMTWEEYQRHLALWDEVMICVGLRGQFWEGAEALMYPPQWLNDSALLAFRYAFQARHPDPSKRLYRRAKGMGLDPGEGGDANRMGTAWAVVDELGVLDLQERRTTDTNDIYTYTKTMIRKWYLDPRKVCIDRGGGGKQVADRLRAHGYPVKTVGFGDPVSADPKVGGEPLHKRLDTKEDRYAYTSRRAQMYHALRLALDPGLVGVAVPGGKAVFAIPGEGNDPTSPYAKLRKELAPVPLLYSKGEGRVYLPPKHRSSSRREAGQEKTMTERIGWSPDLSDALVLALFAAFDTEGTKARAGGMRHRKSAEQLHLEDQGLEDGGWTAPN